MVNKNGKAKFAVFVLGVAGAVLVFAGLQGWSFETVGPKLGPVLTPVFTPLTTVINKKSPIKKVAVEDVAEIEYTITLDGNPLVVTVADELPELIQGLSGVQALTEFGGKLFIFQESQKHGIWMKDMLIPLDVLWFNDAFELVAIEKNMTPATYPQVFTPDIDSRFVIEVRAHLVDALQIELGDMLILPPALVPPDIQ